MSHPKRCDCYSKLVFLLFSTGTVPWRRPLSSPWAGMGREFAVSGCAPMTSEHPGVSIVNYVENNSSLAGGPPVRWFIIVSCVYC